jgi:tripartite-type tricarboxylate transporter receptor subunit TctC
MKGLVRTAMRTLFAALAGLFLLQNAASAAYPTRPVVLVVAFTPGGPSDVLARIIGKKLSDELGQQFVIENRPGAGGNIAAEYVAHAAPDGYVLLMGNNSILATNEALYSKINYSPEKDFLPITLIGEQANILVLNNKVPAKTLQELIALAKAEPGKLNYGSSGFGAAAHLSAELFKTMTKTSMQHVPYKGAAPALQDLIGGQVQLMFATAASVAGQIHSGLVRPIAVTTLKRTELFPEIPTVDELGVKGFEATTWHGLVAPAGTPKEIIDILNAATQKTLKDPSTKKSLFDLGVDISGAGPQEFAAYIKTEIPKWTQIVKDSGAKIE